MSESEKKRRLEYRKRRRRKITVQAIIVALVALITIASVAMYFYVDKTIYINYTEKSDVDYRVLLKDNEHFDKPALDKNQTYVADLIDKIPINFLYELNMESDGVDYQYSYDIETELRIEDKDGAQILSRVNALKEKQSFTKKNSNYFKIAESVLIDYAPYNTFAKDFIATYDLPGVSARLIVRMNVNVIGSCEDFENSSNNHYTVEANVPLAQTLLNVDITSTVPTGESRVIACNNGWIQNVFKIIAIAGTALAAILLAILIAYAYLTRNHDINYSIRVKRLYAAYKAYIQRTALPFAIDGRQIVELDSFDSMLNIRDTIQSPILMNENEDRTCTTFVIPSPTDIIYMYRLKVEDYDELYAPIIVEEPIVEEPVVEEPIVEELTVEPVETVAEAEPVTVADSTPVTVEATERSTAPKVAVVKVKKEKSKKSHTPLALLLGAAVFAGSAIVSFRAHNKKDR